jgi:hypothetical protein
LCIDCPGCLGFEVASFHDRPHFGLDHTQATQLVGRPSVEEQSAEAAFGIVWLNFLLARGAAGERAESGGMCYGSRFPEELTQYRRREHPEPVADGGDHHQCDS